MVLTRRTLVFAVGFIAVLAFLLAGFNRLSEHAIRPFRAVYGGHDADLPDHVYETYTQGRTPSAHDIVPGTFPETHPIDTLIALANDDFDLLSSKQTHGVEAAAALYRKRRGRHPPPRFDEWVQYAESKGSVIVEDFFDQIYTDLEPFWGQPAHHVRVQAPSWPHVITLRDGKAKARDDSHFTAEWMPRWLEAISEIAHLLPDVDMAFNTEDQPRLMVPWETINGYIEAARKTKHTRPSSRSSPILSTYSKIEALSETGPPAKPKPWPYTGPYWTLAKEACHPDSPGRAAKLDSNFSTPPEFPKTYPRDSFYGYVSNWTTAKSVCEHQQLRNLHGSIIAMSGESVGTTLFPIFGGSKIQGVNNDILLPPPMYLVNDSRFEAEDRLSSWREKKDRFIWRGQASGGGHNKENWSRFHRHRFVAMLNSTLVRNTEAILSQDPLHSHEPEPNRGVPHNFYLPDKSLYPLAALNHSSPMGAETITTPMGDWIDPLSNAGFVHLMCDPQDLSVFGPGKECEYTDPYFSQVDRVPLPEQMSYKILPDIDGQTYSGRYRTFLKSGSLPVKATIFAEWHDSRLVPWRHFAPMHNEFMEWWSLLEYFLGYRGPSTKTIAAEKAAAQKAGAAFDLKNKDARAEGRKKLPYVKNQDTWAVRNHDDAMRAIAEQGRDWSERVLRREDMLVYMYRLILEYARICDDDRLSMGYVDDLLSTVKAAA